MCAKSEGKGERANHTRVAKGEEEPDTQGALSIVKELARGAINGGNVINIKGVAHAEAVGKKTSANADGCVLAGRTRGLKEQGEANQVQKSNDGCHGPHLAPVAS